VFGPDFLPQALAATSVLPPMWVMLDQSRRCCSIDSRLMLSVRYLQGAISSTAGPGLDELCGLGRSYGMAARTTVSGMNPRLANLDAVTTARGFPQPA
jgi:hypothetical protein